MKVGLCAHCGMPYAPHEEGSRYPHTHLVHDVPEGVMRRWVYQDRATLPWEYVCLGSHMPMLPFRWPGPIPDALMEIDRQIAGCRGRLSRRFKRFAVPPGTAEVQVARSAPMAADFLVDFDPARDAEAFALRRETFVLKRWAYGETVNLTERQWTWAVRGVQLLRPTFWTLSAPFGDPWHQSLDLHDLGAIRRFLREEGRGDWTRRLKRQPISGLRRRARCFLEAIRISRVVSLRVTVDLGYIAVDAEHDSLYVDQNPRCVPGGEWLALASVLNQADAEA